MTQQDTQPPAETRADREEIARILFDQRQTGHDFDDAADADPESDAGTLYSIVHDDADAILAALTRRAGGDAIPAKEAFDAWRRVQPSGDERFPYDIAKAAFLAGRESATPKPPAGGDAIPAGEVARIILISEDHGCQTHGLFASFDDALAHAKKDGAPEEARWTMTSPDRGCFLDGAVFWTASREPVRAATPKPPAGGDAGAVERVIAELRNPWEGLPNQLGLKRGECPMWACDLMRRAADHLAALALPAPVVEGATDAD